jgi:hypothetical protein
LRFASGANKILRNYFRRSRWQKYLRRFRKPFPLAFLVLAVLAFLGGALHPANNYDALAYRTPRVLHWLAEGQWHWIHTDFQRLNTRTTGFEWLTAPMFAFAGTDRLVFLINIVSFLLLPGRFFAVLTRLGVPPRAAWYWMWLFSSGYGYVLQAGNVVNDMFGALLGLAAIEFALRARREQQIQYLWSSILAAALMTAVKAFNILLLLPWALAVLPSFKLLLRRPPASVLVLLIAASASIAPTAMLNVKYCGDWTGLKAEQPTIGGGGRSLRFLANAINLPLANLAPPIFPFRKQWDQLVQRVVPAPVADELQKNMEPEAAGFQIPEMQMEESAGLGAGVTLLVLVVLVRKIRAGKSGRPISSARKFLCRWGPGRGSESLWCKWACRGRRDTSFRLIPCWSRRFWRGSGRRIFSGVGSGAACRCRSLPYPPCC